MEYSGKVHERPFIFKNNRLFSFGNKSINQSMICYHYKKKYSTETDHDHFLTCFLSEIQKGKNNFKLYFNSFLYVVHILGLQELNDIYIMRTMRRTYEIREVFWKV